MKKLAVFVAAMFSALLVLPLAACDNSSFNIDDYALTLDSEYLSENALADKGSLPWRFTRLEGTPLNYSTGDRMLLCQTTNPVSGDVTYRLFDTKTREYGYTYTQQYKDGNGFYIMRGGPATSAVAVIAQNGQNLIGNDVSALSNPITDKFSAFVGGIKKEIFSVTYTTDKSANGAYPPTTLFYTYNRKTDTYNEIAEEDISMFLSGSAVGSQVISTNVTALGADTENGERPTSLDGWLVSGLGNASSTFTFFRANGDTTMRNDLEVKNAHALGFLKNYLLYYEMEKVESGATSGYNVVFETNTNYNSYSLKYKATLYRYDIFDGTKKKLDCDYYITQFSDRLYNNNAHDYDKAIVSGYKFNRGVAVVSSDVSKTELVINENAKVCLDLSTKPFSLTGEILKLRDTVDFYDNRYFCDDTIFDENLNVVSSLSNAKVYRSGWMIVSTAPNGREFAVNYNGKIIYEPIYSSLDFYGGYAFTTVYERTETHANYIVSNKHPLGTPAVAMAVTSRPVSITTKGPFVSITEGSTTDIYRLDGSRFLSGLSSPEITEMKGGYLVTDEANTAYLFSL